MFLSLVTILQLFFISAKLDKMTKNIQITSEDEKLRDQEGYLAIKAIHGVLDNDQSGSIERYESADVEDLKFGESERAKREKAFHGNDESITVDDLWDAWFQSDLDFESPYFKLNQIFRFEEENKVQQQQPTEDSNGDVNAVKGYNYNPVLDFENEQKLLGVGGGDLSIGGMDGGEHFFFLQTLLRRTYEIESAYLDKQRTDCLLEMREAMELVDKMRKKQSSIVNSLKLATGATSGTDDIDTKIFNEYPPTTITNGCDVQHHENDPHFNFGYKQPPPTTTNLSSFTRPLSRQSASTSLLSQQQFNEESKIQHVIRLSNVPYGFFEKEMNGYFSQFGDVKRVRVIRSKRGHHTGFAYVEFKNEKVAEIAAKSMNNYLLAEKKLGCCVVDQNRIPKCIRGGKRFGKIIEPGENRLKETLKRLAPKNEKQERVRLKRFTEQLRGKMLKIKNLGINYEFNFEQKLDNYLEKNGIDKNDLFKN
uniref:RRM domain-containing protein n=1 Tax=Meloidogyne javanica TaxID=6303 RepID=A0A915LJ44_MELJA